jgi:SAM-dependent methyltransferase
MPFCEICENDKFILLTTRIREGEGRIMKCSLCGLVIQDLGWDEERLRRYYEEEYQSTNSLVTGKVQTPQEHFEDRTQTIGSVFNQISPLLSRSIKVLEVGCGAGELLSLIRPHVADCAGVELNTSLTDFIKGKLGIRAYAGDVNKINIKEKFDLIISIATLDHLPNPFETLSCMKKLLTPLGKIYIEVPNIDEALNCYLPEHNRILYNNFFWHRAHLFYFSRDTITALFRKAGLSVRITSRHEYTLKNFLNWYFLGKPQSDFVTGLTEIGLLGGSSDFETRMNEMFSRMDSEFKRIMAETFRGDNLCCLGFI